MNHIKGDIFYEDPKPINSDRFALKVTYWKDSEIIKRGEGKPYYPVSYYLAHVINTVALRYASIILNSKDLLIQSERMKKNCDFY